jgi:hypothetical protein
VESWPESKVSYLNLFIDHVDDYDSVVVLTTTGTLTTTRGLTITGTSTTTVI